MIWHATMTLIGNSNSVVKLNSTGLYGVWKWRGLKPSGFFVNGELETARP